METALTIIQKNQCSMIRLANIHVATMPIAVVKASPVGMGESVKCCKRK